MTNQWNDWIKYFLLAEGLKKASIHTLDGRILGASDRFTVTPEQASRAWLYLKLKHAAPTDQLTIAGQDYRIERDYANFIYGYHENGGCILAPSNYVLVIALHDEKVHATKAAFIVTRLVEHLNFRGFDTRSMLYADEKT